MYRTITIEGRAGQWGYGHIAKPNSVHDYRNRVSDHLIIVYPISGHGVFVDGAGREHRVEPFDILIHWPGADCSLVVEPDGTWREYWILADRRFAEAMEHLGVLHSSQSVVPAVGDSLVAEGFRLFGYSLKTMHDADVDRLTVHLHELLVEIDRLTRAVEVDEDEIDLVRRACRTLAGSFDERVSVPQIAGELGLSYERFRKLFVRHIGVPPGEYRIRRRIDRARELLRQGRMSNRRVAAVLGYADAFCFSKQFKRVVGESPDAFRRGSGCGFGTEAPECETEAMERAEGGASPTARGFDNSSGYLR